MDKWGGLLSFCFTVRYRYGCFLLSRFRRTKCSVLSVINARCAASPLPRGTTLWSAPSAARPITGSATRRRGTASSRRYTARTLSGNPPPRQEAERPGGPHLPLPGVRGPVPGKQQLLPHLRHPPRPGRDAPPNRPTPARPTGTATGATSASQAYREAFAHRHPGRHPHPGLGGFSRPVLGHLPDGVRPHERRPAGASP